MGRKPKPAKTPSDLIVTLRLPLAAAEDARRRAAAEDRPFSTFLRRLIIAGLSALPEQTMPAAGAAARAAGAHAASPLSCPTSGEDASGGPLRESVANQPHGTGLARLFSAEDAQRAARSINPEQGA